MKTATILALAGVAVALALGGAWVVSCAVSGLAAVLLLSRRDA
jgi:hypothetical protein